MSNAYHQSELREEDKKKTAFSSRRGHFEFNRMPFGLIGAPFTFQRLMNMVLESENWQKCVIYLDDVLIFGRDFDEHIKYLEDVFYQLRRAGVKLSLEKCQFLQRSVKFLGHIISSKGVEEMKSFIGLSSY